MTTLKVTLSPDYFSLAYFYFASFRSRVEGWLTELGPGYNLQGLPIFATTAEAAVVYVTASNTFSPQQLASLKDLWSQHGHGVKVSEIVISSYDPIQAKAQLDAENPNPIAGFVTSISDVLGVGSGFLLLLLLVIGLVSLKPWTWRT